MQTEILGNAESITSSNGVLTIKTNEAEAHISVYSASIIRVNISRTNRVTGSFAVIQDHQGNINYTETADVLEINTSQLKLVINKSPLRFNFYTAGGQVLSEDDARFGTNWQGDRVVNYRKLYADEKFIGLGEKTGDLNRRGCNYVNWNTDAALHTITTS